MILYVDSSALIKRYLTESDSPETMALIERAEQVGTALITRAEVAATLAKAVRVGALAHAEAAAQLDAFRKDWNDYDRIAITETVIARADECAWQYQLRGYDAVQLAAALIWQESLQDAVTLATFDRQLWAAAKQTKLQLFPHQVPTSR